MAALQDYVLGDGRLSDLQPLLTSYRRAWRNPSTHDHCLDIDEDDAKTVATAATILAEHLFQFILAQPRNENLLVSAIDAGQPPITQVIKTVFYFLEGVIGTTGLLNSLSPRSFAQPLKNLLKSWAPGAHVKLVPPPSVSDGRSALIASRLQQEVFVEIVKAKEDKGLVTSVIEHCLQHCIAAHESAVVLCLYHPDALGKVHVVRFSNSDSPGQVFIVSAAHSRD